MTHSCSDTIFMNHPQTSFQFYKQVFSFTNSTENCSYTYPKKLWVHIYGRRYSCDRPGWIYRIYTYIHSIQLLGREHFIPSLTQFEHLSPCFLIHLHRGTLLHNTVPCGISLIIATQSGSKVKLQQCIPCALLVHDK